MATAALMNPTADSVNNTAGSAAAAAPPAPPSGPSVERRCENADCNVSKLVSLVPKRKCTQFVTEPTVMEKPLLINGFTTVFQVDGSSAKLHDLKNPNNVSQPTNKTIFRIVPNTHAHIVNYVVVDADGDSLRKINEGDPATMRKLLESQKVSADQMLKKLMAGHGTPPAVSVANNLTSTAAVTNTTAGTTMSVSSVSSAPPTATRSSVPINVGNKSLHISTSSTVSGGYGSGVAATPPIQLPLRMHPNLKITAVASADSVAALRASPTPATLNVAPPTVPLITPVPLSALQNAVPASSTSATTSTNAAGASVDTVEKPIFDKMQAELQELRRTVAMLAEAQAKSQQPPTNARLTKRARPN